jgi:ketosteroid isomerase-like protein
VKVKPEKSLGNEGAIRSLIADWVSALRAKDLDKLMSHYAPGVVLFDGVAPLQMGPDMYRKNWEGYFN